jgi:hypothetical protein
MSDDVYTTSQEFAYDFIKVLSKFKQVNENECINSKNTVFVLKSPHYYSFFSFRCIISELFYQAVNSIPEIITHYTISCKSKEGTSELQIGIFDDLDDEGEISVAKIVSPKCMLILNKEAVHNLYVANKTNYFDYETVNTIISLLYMGEDEPTIKTWYISSKRDTKF